MRSVCDEAVAAHFTVASLERALAVTGTPDEHDEITQEIT